LHFVSPIIFNYEDGFCDEKENNYKPLSNMIVVKHEMAARFIRKAAKARGWPGGEGHCWN
jgi:hypothetical protein